jgi:hypothetical protein
MVFLLSLLINGAILALAQEQVYLAPDSFLKEVFGDVPKPAVFWVTPEAQAEATRIFGHPPRKLRERYWSDGAKTVWILEEIGKEELITAGFVVQGGKIELSRVLIYRESRGMEVRYPAFLRQFDGAELTADKKLSRQIDGISGATLSVWAMTRMARQALYYAGATTAK